MDVRWWLGARMDGYFMDNLKDGWMDTQWILDKWMDVQLSESAFGTLLCSTDILYMYKYKHRQNENKAPWRNVRLKSKPNHS